MAKLSAAPIPPGKLTFKYSYDFAVDGGAVSTITMRSADGPLPNTFIVQEAFIDVIAGFTGAAGCTGAVSTGQGAGDLVVAAIVAGAPFSTTGPKVTIALLGTVATWIKMTAARSPTIAFAVNAATAGTLNLFIEGYLSAAS